MMKPRTVLLALLLSATALAFTPTAQAAEPICMTSLCLPDGPAVTWCGLKAATPGSNPYTTVDPREAVWGTDAGCDIDVYGPSMDCAPPSSTVVERTAGPVHARVGMCDGGIPDRIPPITVASSAMQPPIYCVMAPCPGPYPPPAVSWCMAEAATPEPLRSALWGTDAGCDVDVDTHWYCLYGEVPVDRTVGPMHVTTRVCTPPIEPAT